MQRTKSVLNTQNNASNDAKKINNKLGTAFKKPAVIWAKSYDIISTYDRSNPLCVKYERTKTAINGVSSIQFSNTIANA